MKQTSHEGPCCDHDALGTDFEAKIASYSQDTVVLNNQFCDVALLDGKIGKILQKGFDPELIGLLVTLGSGGTNTWTFGSIEHPELDPRRIRIEGHHTPKGINLPDHVTLCQSTDGRVAGHLGNRIGILSQQECLCSHRGSDMGGLDTSMSGPHNQHIKLFRQDEHQIPCSTWNNTLKCLRTMVCINFRTCEKRCGLFANICGLLVVIRFVELSSRPSLTFPRLLFTP